MKTELAVGLGVIGFGLGCAAVCIVEGGRVTGMEKKLNDICKSIDGISDSVDLTIPEELTKVAVSKAAEKAAKASVNKAIDSAIKTAVDDIYKDVAGDVKKKLEDQVNLASIERIEKQVSEKVANTIVKTSPFFGIGDSTSKESLVKTCVDNGMDAWEIKRILEAVK